MPDFQRRSGNQEIMDNLGCSGEVVNQTLRELEVINQWLGGNQVTLDGVRRLIKGRAVADFTVADLGCGSGDMLRLISTWAKKNGVAARFTGIDANPNITAFAETRSTRFPDIRFETTNIFSDEFKRQNFDIILATLFTHHFSDEELTELFISLKGQAAVGIVINDIHRHWFAFHSIRLLTRLFSRSAMVKFDAPLSVLRAFKRSELEKILENAGIERYFLRWRWAFRWQLIIPASGNAGPH